MLFLCDGEECVDFAELAEIYFSADEQEVFRAETLLRNEVVEHTERTVYSVVPPPALPVNSQAAQRAEMAEAVARYFAPEKTVAEKAVEPAKVITAEPFKSGLMIAPEQNASLPPKFEARLAEKICDRVEARLKARILGAGGRFG